LRKRSEEQMTNTNHSLGALAAAVGALVAVGLVVLSLLAVEAQPVAGKTAHSSSSQEQHGAPPPAQSNAPHEKELLLDKDPQGNPYVAGELLVSYKKQQGAFSFEKAKDAALKEVGGKVEKDFPNIGVQHISLPEVKNERSQEARQSALERKKQLLEQDPDVKSVSYNYVGEATWVPDDTYYGKQWALPNIKASGAWDIERGSRDIKIAMLDSGLDFRHPDLPSYPVSRGVVGQKDFVNNDSDASDDLGHGTVMTSVAAATTNNTRGVAGVCPNCSLLIAKVLDANSKVQASNAIAGVDWAIGQRANVINMSFRFTSSPTGLQEVIHKAWTQGAVVVSTAGNEGTDNIEVYPGSYPDVIGVAATGGGDPFSKPDRDSRAVYPWAPGNFCYQYSKGPNGIRYCSRRVGASNAGDWVDVAAPGKDIYTATWCKPYVPGQPQPICSYANAYDGGGWGTSVAAPHVSGLAGLIFSKGGHEGHPAHWSPAEVRSRIESTARGIGVPGKDPVFGYGVINAQAAVGGARCPVGQPPNC
jgi:thermitase